MFGDLFSSGVNFLWFIACLVLIVVALTLGFDFG